MSENENECGSKFKGKGRSESFSHLPTRDEGAPSIGPSICPFRRYHSNSVPSTAPEARPVSQTQDDLEPNTGEGISSAGDAMGSSAAITNQDDSEGATSQAADVAQENPSHPTAQSASAPTTQDAFENSQNPTAEYVLPRKTYGGQMSEPKASGPEAAGPVAAQDTPKPPQNCEAAGGSQATQPPEQDAIEGRDLVSNENPATEPKHGMEEGDPGVGPSIPAHRNEDAQPKSILKKPVRITGGAGSGQIPGPTRPHDGVVKFKEAAGRVKAEVMAAETGITPPVTPGNPGITTPVAAVNPDTPPVAAVNPGITPPVAAVNPGITPADGSVGAEAMPDANPLIVVTSPGGTGPEGAPTPTPEIERDTVPVAATPSVVRPPFSDGMICHVEDVNWARRNGAQADGARRDGAQGDGCECCWCCWRTLWGWGRDVVSAVKDLFLEGLIGSV